MDLFSRNKFILQLQLCKFYLATGKNHWMTNLPIKVLLNKMLFTQEKVYCIFKDAKTSLVTVVQGHFCTKFHKEPPHRHNISKCAKQFQDTGCLCKNKRTGRKETKPAPEWTSIPSLDWLCWATGFDMSSLATEITRSKDLWYFFLLGFP